MRSKEKLSLPVRELLREPSVSAQHGRALWTGIEARRKQRRVRRRVGSGLLAVAALVTLAFVFRLTTPERAQLATSPGRLTMAAGEPLASSIAPAQTLGLPLSDGSRLTVRAGSRLDVLETSEKRVALALRSGSARFDIKPHGPRTWSIDCGAITVEVLGTAFDITRSSERVEVDVLRGAVLVRGAGVPDSVQRLNGGERLAIPVHPEEASEPSSKSAVVPVLLVPSEPAPASSAAPAEDTSETPAPRRSRRAHRNAPSSEAPEMPEPAAAPAATASVGPSAAELLLEADALRRSGKARAAIEPLQRVLELHATDPQAALAAFTLGRLQLDVLDQPAEAVHALARALSLKPPAALAEDVQARLVEAYGRAGQRARACEAAATYRQNFPAGRREGLVSHFCPREPAKP